MIFELELIFRHDNDIAISRYRRMSLFLAEAW